MPTKVASGQLTVTDTYDGVVLLLSNDSHTIPSDMLGGTLDLTGCTTTASVISGPNDDTANWGLTFTKGAGVSGSVTGATFTVTGLTNDTGYVDVTATRSGFATLTARFSLAKAKRGLEGISVVLSNEAHTMPADNAGVVGSYTNSGTTLQVFEGSTALTAAANTTANSSFTVDTPVVSPTGKITVGGRSYAGTVATVAQHSAMDAATDTLTISYPITVKRANGTTLTLTRTQTLTKSKSGSNGNPGSNGTRGSVHLFVAVTDSVWSDTSANTALASAPYNGKVIADRVTEYNLATNFSQCRYWTGSAWSVITEVLDGNLLVTGSITANKLNINDLYAQNATVTGSFLVGDYNTNFVRIGGSSHILAQQGSRVLFSVDANGTGFINGAGIGAQTLGPESFSASAIEFIRGQMGAAAPTGGGVRTAKAALNNTTITLSSLNSNGGAVDLVVSYLAASYGVETGATPSIPSVTVTVKRGATTVSSQVYSGTRHRDTSVSSTYWEIRPPNINMAVQDVTPPTGGVVYSVTLVLSNIDVYQNLGEVSFGASQATSGGGSGYSTAWADITGKPDTATRWPTLGEIGAQASLGYTPIQQGGGAGQGANKVYIGWASPKLNLQVDSTNFGSAWPIDITGNAAYATSAGSVAAGGVTISSGDGFVYNAGYAAGGWARGLVIKNNSGTRLAGAGFYGTQDNTSMFAVSLTTNWWDSPQLELISQLMTLRSSSLLLSSGWNINWGGLYTSGYPTLTGNSSQLYFYPIGNGSSPFVMGQSKFAFPSVFNAMLIPSNGGTHLGFADLGGSIAKNIAVGGITISSNYNDIAYQPANGLYVKGQSKFNASAVIQKNDVNLSLPVWQEGGYQLQLYAEGLNPVVLSFHRGGQTAVGLVHNGDGIYLTNGLFKANGFSINNYPNSYITSGYNNAEAFSFRTPSGMIDIGALSATYAHFVTNCSYFYMNKALSAVEGYYVYGSPWSFGPNGRATIGVLNTRHLEGLDVNGTAADNLYINYLSGRDVHIGNNGGARLIAKHRDNEVYARWMPVVDQRGRGLVNPNAYGADVSFEFLAGSTAGNSGEDYIASMVMRSYGTGSDWSGGPVHKIHFGKSTGKMWHQTGDGAGWGSYREIAQFEDNGYFNMRNWCHFGENGTGLFWTNSTHFFSPTGGVMVLRGGPAETYINMQTNSGTSRGSMYADASGIGFLYTNGAWGLRVDSATQMTYVTDIQHTSDSRVKENQQPIKNALDKLLKYVTGKTFIRTDQNNKPSAGTIAQDWQKALPEAVSADTNGKLSLNDAATVGLLVEAIKELAAFTGYEARI